VKPIGVHNERWTPERIGIAHGMLHSGLSLTKTATRMGITRAALTAALKRHGAMPRKIWICSPD
jgi:hypothetical protein